MDSLSNHLLGNLLELSLPSSCAVNLGFFLQFVRPRNLLSTRFFIAAIGPLRTQLRVLTWQLVDGGWRGRAHLVDHRFFHPTYLLSLLPCVRDCHWQKALRSWWVPSWLAKSTLQLTIKVWIHKAKDRTPVTMNTEFRTWPTRR